MRELPPPLAPLKAYCQFVIYRLVPSAKPGKMDKLPCDYRTGWLPAKGSGGAHNPEIWCDFPTAAAAVAAGRGDGVGFVVTEADPFFFLDIDNALQADNTWSPLAVDLCGRFAGAAVEVSQSGRGLHIIGSGTVPAHGCRNQPLGLELYTSLRFVALTGTNAVGDVRTDCTAAMARVVPAFFPSGSAPAAGPNEWTTGPVPEWDGPTDDDELIRRTLASADRSAAAAFGGEGVSFRDLWEANTDALAKKWPSDNGPYDASSADYALATRLAFWTGKDCERIRTLMYRSALVRDKWEREDYLPRTILGACNASASVRAGAKASLALSRDKTFPSVIETPTGERPRPLFRQLPTAPDFPCDALGPELAHAAMAIETIVQCPLACAANSVLAVAALAAQGCADVVLPIGQGKSAPLSLFILTVLESGERKSSADKMALKPVRDTERELSETRKGQLARYQSALAAYEAHRKHLAAEMKGDRAGLESALNTCGPVPQPPLLPVIAPSGDQTMEGLFRIYEQGPPSLAMLCDDAATFLGGHSLKAEQKRATTGNLCRAWDGSRLERIRGGDGVTVLFDRRLSTHFMVQPGVAADFLSDPQFADQGLLARVLVSAPMGRAGSRFRHDEEYRKESANVAADLDAYNAAVRRLLGQPPQWKDENDRSSGVKRGALILSAAARALYVGFNNEIEAELGPGGRLVPVKAFASKLAEHAVRIAGVLTLTGNDGAGQIEECTLANAMRLARYYLEEALRLFAWGAVDPALKRAEELRVWLCARPDKVIGLTQIYQLGPSATRDAGAARNTMKLLCDHGWAELIDGGAVIHGKISREAYRIIADEAL